MSKKAVASLMAEVASSSDDESSNVLSFRDCLTGTRVLLALVPDGILQSPKKLYAHIMHPLELIKSEARFFAHHCRPQTLSLLSSIGAECFPSWRVRLLFRCVAFACRRLATAPANLYMTFMSWGWAELVMERVTRGRVKEVQVWVQRRACCAVRCACRASACVRCVFDACCRKRWPVLRCVAAHRSGCIKRAAAFILVRRLLLPPALQEPAFGIRHLTETAFRCFAM